MFIAILVLNQYTSNLVDFNNSTTICYGYVSSSRTTLPIAYTTFYVITFGQADQSASAHVGRTIWYTSDKQLGDFKDEKVY